MALGEASPREAKIEPQQGHDGSHAGATVARMAHQAHIYDRLREEGLVPLTVAAKEAGVGHVHAFTLIRWARNGSRGIRLDAIQPTGVWLTSVAAMQRFLRAAEDARRGEPAVDRRAQRAIARAELAARGIRQGVTA